MRLVQQQRDYQPTIDDLWSHVDPNVWVEGTVKWYEGRYGYITATGEFSDNFLHMSVLRKSGINIADLVKSLDAGMTISVRFKRMKPENATERPRVTVVTIVRVA